MWNTADKFQKVRKGSSEDKVKKYYSLYITTRHNVSLEKKYEVIMIFLAICMILVDAARLSGDSHSLLSDYNIFQNSALLYSYHERRYWENWERQHATKNKKTKFMKRTSLRTFKVKFLTCNVFVFYKNLFCRLRSSCLPA